jgi:hypothetical protein
MSDHGTAPLALDGDRLGWRFDLTAADTAVDELLLTAQSLLEAVALLETDIPVVTEDWEGRFREVFDVDAFRYDVALRTMAENLFTIASLVRARSIEAAAAWTP